MSEEELQAYLARLESDVADLHLALQAVRDELSDAVAGGSVQAPAPSLVDVEKWVTDELASLYARHVGPAWRWCPQWADHPEAVLRLTALLVGWREAQRSGRVLAFLRDLDGQMAVLADPAGLFASCGREHHAPDRLPCARAHDEAGDGQRLQEVR